MSDTSKPGSGAASGSQRKGLKPWEVAVKLFRTGDGRVVDIEHASDAEFQAWIVSQGIPVDDDGIPEWAFEDRYGVINHALAQGVDLAFVEEKDIGKTSGECSESEVFEGGESASQAG